jgi:hypothetical protein
MSNLSQILTLTRLNFKEWKENLRLVLRIMDIDQTLRENRPTPVVTASITDLEKETQAKWDQSDKLSIMAIKKTIPEAFQRIVHETFISTKEYIKALKERFIKSNKAEITTLLTNIVTMKYIGKDGIREHIIEDVKYTT